MVRENVLEDIVELYNKLHGVEAQAKILEIKDNGIVFVEFKGSFCHTCGVRDWLEDLAYLAQSRGIPVELVEMVEPRGEERDFKRIGVFKLSGSKNIACGGLSGGENC
jgi:hypothetical protein